jgi:hypothetical protein
MRDRENSNRWAREYYYKNLERNRDAHRAYYWEHREERIEKAKEYAKTHLEQRRRADWRYRRNHPERSHARIIAKYHIPLKSVCELCNKRAEERHHPNYLKPLEIVHLCHECHRKLHAKRRVA